VEQVGNMAAWRRKLARSAWAGLLRLFAVRAVAGPALCELYGEHHAPPGEVQTATVHEHAAQTAHGAQGADQHSSDEAPANDRSDHVCDEPVYLTDGWSSVSTFKWSMAMDALASCGAPFAGVRPHAVDTIDAPRRPAHPPPPRAPMDVSPRLRI
jgi:hypothetical protein